MNTPRRLAPALFCALILAAVAAGCAGGGQNSASLPATSSALGAPALAAARRHSSATLTLHIPRKRHRHRRGPAYISPNMQSMTVGVQLVTTSPWPSLAPQTFVVATPQPCTAVAGGLNCTFALKAYAGKNVFTFNEYAQQSPSPSDTPLGTLTTGATTVNGSALSFTLQGVVNKVVLGVPNPESSSAPNTQALPIGATSSFPLTISPYDASNSGIATDTFSSPITIQVAPASAGVTLALNKQCAGDTVTATSVTLNCASDLTQVTVAYDGTVTSAGGLSYVDKATLTATPQLAANTPAPANVALESNVLAYQIVAASGNQAYATSNIALEPATGKLLFAANVNGGYNFVEFDPSRPNNAVTLTPLAFQVTHVALGLTGNIWTNNYGTSNLAECFSSVSAAPVAVTLNDSNANPVYGAQLALDRSGNVWFAGEDYGNYTPAAGYFPDSCTTSTQMPLLYFGVQYNAPYAIGLAAPSGGNPGIWAPVQSGTAIGLYGLNTQSGSSPPPAATWPSGVIPESMVADPSYNLFVSAQNQNGGAAQSIVNEVPAGTSNLQTLLTLAPGSTPYQLDQYSGTQSSAQSLVVSDGYYSAAILAGPVSASTEPLYLVMNDTYDCGPVAYDKTGSPWIVCSNYDGSMWAYRLVVTDTWSAVTSTIPYPGNTYDSVLGVPESSGNDSSPFTVTVNPSPGVIATGTPWPAGFNHAIPIQVVGEGTDTLTIVDKNGRAQQVTITVPLEEEGGARHRRPHRPH